MTVELRKKVEGIRVRARPCGLTRRIAASSRANSAADSADRDFVMIG
ncbi:MAG TPA: hypothetical protein VE155_08725 [Pseudonocardiaceae bacterium]|nr:hypothetical protein [Pseudonocardiaceae bacterium]